MGNSEIRNELVVINYHLGSVPTSSNIFSATLRCMSQCSRAAATRKLPRDIIFVSCKMMKRKERGKK